MSDSSGRAAVLREAHRWLGTPYHHRGRVAGGGVDCLMLLAEVYERAGIISHAEPMHYPPDWHMHRDAERYLDGIRRYAREVGGPPRPADVAVFRFGRTFSHGAIVTAWPRVIHAFVRTGVVFGDAAKVPLAGRAVKFFDPF
ncbi:MAG: hydrolase [Alphaproteobacteria bacterium]|nr:hydrolase [Alphaproteobacteria bacterium]